MISIKFISDQDPLIESVIKLGDENSKTLGHFPRNAFYESAFRKQILVCTNEKNQLLGYLLFRHVKTKNRIGITHLCVTEEFRGKGISEELFKKLIEKYENVCRGIGLNCREDYEFAKKRWSKLGFTVRATKRSRSKVENFLSYWWYEFANEDLFSGLQNENNKIRVCLDFNIIVSLRDERVTDFDECRYLLEDWIIDDIEYCYATETYNEINRDSDKSRSIASRTFLKNFSQIICNDSHKIEIQKKLNEILKGKDENQLSDERQLSEAIVAGIKYFITLDSELLYKQKEIREGFGMQIYRPSEFIVEFDKINNSEQYIPGRLGGSIYTKEKVSSHDLDNLVNSLLYYNESEKKSAFRKIVSDLIANKLNSDVWLIKDNSGKIIGATGLKFEKDHLEVIFFRTIRFSLESQLSQQMISDIINVSIQKSIRLIIVDDSILNGLQRDILISFHFIKKKNNWAKIVIPHLVNANTLFDEFPILEDYIDKKKYLFTLYNADLKAKQNLLYSIEKILWPIKIADLKIPTYIVPIKPYWAAQLFDFHSANETIFGGKPKLLWNRENIYYRSPFPYIENETGRILWYASEKSGYSRSKAIVATSYLEEYYIGKAKDLFNKFKEIGIYEWTDISLLTHNNHEREIKALRFTDTQVFEKPIYLDTLKKVVKNLESKEVVLRTVSKYGNNLFNKIYKLTE